ncbi:MAG: hypothetical protein PHP93_03830, partial [Kiritimatiellales bacterium]|nr:hypothetical protein [Kiritimatiellales bacterium]
MKQLLFVAILGVLLGAGCAHVQPLPTSSDEFNFPLVAPEHEHMRALLANAMNYLKPENRLVDPASGYPV